MRRLVAISATAVTAAAALAGLGGASSAATAGKPAKPELGHFKHLVVIYEENHSFDNLYGGWGKVNGHDVDGRQTANAPGTTQVDQGGSAYPCLYQNDANLATPNETFKWIDGSTGHPGYRSPDACTSQPLPNPNQTQGGLPSGATTYDSHFANAPFNINHSVTPADHTCAPATAFMPNGVLSNDPQGLPGGCTRDIVHRFYQEQYQLDGGRQDRYSTGSDAAGLTQGYYDTKSLPIYQYLHSAGAPKYVLADHFFQAAFGGSFLNHQYLIAAQAPRWDTNQAPSVPAGKNSVIDPAGFPNKSYPLYRPDSQTPYNDGPLTQKCDAPTTVPGFACGNYAVNTMQPSWAPSGGGSNVLPGINDVDPSQPFYERNIGDELSAKGVTWNWYAGGWDAAASGHPDPLFQFHHQPFNYFQNYAPGQPGRAHLQDETRFIDAAQNGTLPAVSFVKPIGEENEHPGYASTDNGESHLVDLLRTIENGPDAGNTLVVVTYDEFGGQWDHVAPPGQGNQSGPRDQFGPGTRIPALVIGRSLHHSTVDHTSYDTTSILATIERAFGVAPLSSRDAAVNSLSHALNAAETKAD